MRNRTDLTVVKGHDLVTVLQLTDGRDNCGCTCTECLVELALVISLGKLVDLNVSLGNSVALASEYLKAGLSCDTAED